MLLSAAGSGPSLLPLFVATFSLTNLLCRNIFQHQHSVHDVHTAWHLLVAIYKAKYSWLPKVATDVVVNIEDICQWSASVIKTIGFKRLIDILATFSLLCEFETPKNTSFQVDYTFSYMVWHWTGMCLAKNEQPLHNFLQVLASEHKMNYVPGSSMNFFDREVYTSIQHGIVWQYLARGGPLDFATRSLDLCGVPANVSSIDVASPEHLLHSGVWSVEFMYSCVHAAGHGAFFLSAADTCNARCLETHSLALHNYTMSSTKLDSAQRMCLDLPDAPSRLTIRGACLGGVYHSFILYRKDWSSSKWARPLGLPQVDQILEKSMHRRTEKCTILWHGFSNKVLR